MLRALRLVTGFALAATALANCVGVPAVPASATQAAAFDSNQAWEHLRQMVSIGPRPAGSPGLRQTRAYITRQITAMGLAVQEQTFTAQTPQGPIESLPSSSGERDDLGA
jgi:hypothetical protein